MGSAVGDFWIVLAHEFTSCRRNLPFILYSLAFPLFIILLALAVNLPTIQRAAQKPRIAVHTFVNPSDQSPVAVESRWFLEALNKDEKVKVVTSSDPDADLRNGKIDALLTIPAGEPNIDLKLRGTLSEEQSKRIENAIRWDRYKLFVRLPEMKGADLHQLSGFSVKEKPVAFSKTGAVEVVIILTGLMMFHLASSMSSSTQAVWAEETRTKAILNVLMLPVHRMAYVTAKAAVMTVLALLSVLSYQLALVVCAVALAAVSVDPGAASGSSTVAASSAAVVAGSAPSDMAKSIMAIPWLQFFFLALFCFISFSYFCAGISLLCVALLRPKFVSSWLGWLMTALASPVFASFDPNIALSDVTMWIPALNLLLVLKACLLGNLVAYQAFVAFAEMVVGGALIGFFGAQLLGSDRFFSNTLEW